MTEDHDRSWRRLCAAVGGFRAEHGAWPSRVRLDQRYIAELRDKLLSPGDFQVLASKIELIPEPGAEFVAEDGQGRSYRDRSGARDGASGDIDAEGWLGIEPLPEVW